MARIATTTAVLLGLLCARPAGHLSAQSLRVPYQTFTLRNGLQVIVHEDHSVPVVAVNTWYHVGSSDEKPGRTGFAHLFEHIMFMGSQHVPNGEFDKLLEKAKANAPARRLVRIEDVGAATAFLAHDVARLITGDTIYIDGGYHVVD